MKTLWMLCALVILGGGGAPAWAGALHSFEAVQKALERGEALTVVTHFQDCTADAPGQPGRITTYLHPQNLILTPKDGLGNAAISFVTNELLDGLSLQNQPGYQHSLHTLLSSGMVNIKVDYIASGMVQQIRTFTCALNRGTFYYAQR